MRSLRIAFLHPCYWPEVHRGGERIVHDVSRRLLDRGHHVGLITSHPSLRGVTREDGLPVLRVPRGRGEQRLRDHRFDDYWTHVPWTYAALAHGDHDLVHSFFPTDCVAAAAWARRTGRPAVLTLMGVPSPHRIRFDATPRAAQGAATVTALSKAASAAYMYRYGFRSEVVSPPVEVDAFTPGGPRAEHPTILCPAPIEVARKRVRLLIEAFAIVRRARPDARLRLLRPKDPAVERELSSRHDGIELFDSVPEPTLLAPQYRAAWVTALPSLGEAFGLVVAESLACGTPVVATDFDAFPEIVDRPGIGRLFDGDEPAALATALTEALELTEDAGTAEACRTRAEDFSPQRCAARFEEIYAGALSP